MKKNIFLVGATSDIATELAHLYAQNGYDLILSGRDEKRLDSLRQELETTYSVQTYPLRLDASDEESVRIALAAASAIGYSDAVIAYGYLGDQTKAESDKSERDNILHTNFLSVVDVLESCALHLSVNKQGCICGISSVAGDRGRQSNYIYGSAKGALSLYLQGMRNRLFPKGVHVLTVKPGFVATKMTKGLLKDTSLLVASPKRVAKDIFRGMTKRKNVVYTPVFWRLILSVIRLLPEWLFKRLRL